MRGISSSVAIVLWVVFLQQYYGYTLTQVTLLDIPFWVGKLLFEIPTGVVADRFGRRVSLAIGAAMTSLIWLVFSLTGAFAVLVIAQFVGAMAATFLSGADEAILYESVDALGRKAEYSKITGRMRAVETISAMLAGIGVGYIATFNLVLPVILASIIYALSILPIWLMKETGGASLPIKDQVKPPSYLHTVREAWAVLSGFVVLRWSAAYLVVLGSVSFYVAVFFQPYILALGFTLAVLGPATVLIQLFGIAGSLSVDKVQHKIGSTNLLFLAPLIIVPGLVLTGAVRLIPDLSQALGFSAVIGAAGLSSFFFSMTQPVLLFVIQGRVSSEARATLLSIQSALFTIFLIITEPGLGVIADHFGVHFSYLGMAGVTAAFLFPLLWWGRRWFKNGARHIHEIPG